jgi:UDP-N-acetyl-D-mannosaminuronate dehydrogenase
VKGSHPARVTTHPCSQEAEPVTRAEDHLPLLKDLGADVRYHDPYVPTLTGHNPHSLPLEEVLQNADLTLIVTAHPSVDHDLVLQRSSLVVDLRGITRRSPVKDAVRL